MGYTCTTFDRYVLTSSVIHITHPRMNRGALVDCPVQTSIGFTTQIYQRGIVPDFLCWERQKDNHPSIRHCTKNVGGGVRMWFLFSFLFQLCFFMILQCFKSICFEKEIWTWTGSAKPCSSHATCLSTLNYQCHRGPIKEPPIFLFLFLFSLLLL